MSSSAVLPPKWEWTRRQSAPRSIEANYNEGKGSDLRPLMLQERRKADIAEGPGCANCADIAALLPSGAGVVECLTSRTPRGGSMDSRDYTRRMQRLSDEELTEIVSFGEKDGYLPEAVEAARKELVARNLSETDASRIGYSVETGRNREEELASQPLSWPARVAFFILPVVSFSLPIMVFAALSLRTRGYRQKSSDAWKCIGLGIALWVGLIIFLFSSELWRE